MNLNCEAQYKRQSTDFEIDFNLKNKKNEIHGSEARDFIWILQSSEYRRIIYQKENKI